MDCRDVEEALPDLLDGKRSAATDAHLASCADCRARFRELATTAALVADLADLYRPPADADASLQRALYARLRRHRAGINPGWLAVAAVAGAAIAAIALRSAPAPEPPPRVETPVGGAPAATSDVDVAPAVPATAAPDREPSHARRERRFREAVQAAKTETPAIEPVLAAYAEDPEDAEDALAVDETLGGYFDQELRPRLLRGTLDRAASAIGSGRWLEGCEAARLARRLDRGSEPAAALLARCEGEAERIAEQARSIPDDSARRTLLRGALDVATPGSAVYRAIAAAVTAPPEPSPPPAAAARPGSR
jgi:hypothetical protein